MTVLCAGTPEEAGMRPERIARLRELCAELVASGETSALGLLVARRGVVVLHDAWGPFRPGSDEQPLRTDHLFGLRSASKPVTALAVMQCAERGLLSINRAAIEYLPELAAGGEGVEEVTLHQLLTHTSGWDDDAFFELIARRVAEGAAGVAPEPTQHALLAQLLHWTWDLPLQQPAGSGHIYCNRNYELLGEIVRRVSGISFEALLRESIFEPLGMYDTWLSVPEAVSPRVAKQPAGAPHADPDGANPGGNSREMEEWPLPAGGVYSTTGDLAIFAQCMLDGGLYGETRILSRPGVEAMTRCQIPGVSTVFRGLARREAGYGYGWFVGAADPWPFIEGALVPEGFISHAGAGGPMIWFDPSNELVLSIWSGVMSFWGDDYDRFCVDKLQDCALSAIVD